MRDLGGDACAGGRRTHASKSSAMPASSRPGSCICRRANHSKKDASQRPTILSHNGTGTQSKVVGSARAIQPPAAAYTQRGEHPSPVHWLAVPAFCWERVRAKGKVSHFAAHQFHAPHLSSEACCKLPSPASAPRQHARAALAELPLGAAVSRAEVWMGLTLLFTDKNGSQLCSNLTLYLLAGQHLALANHFPG